MAVTTTSTAGGKSGGSVIVHDPTSSSVVRKHTNNYHFSNKASASSSAEERAIMEIDDAIQKDGGAMGGWLEHDHNTFQRLCVSIFGIGNENITRDSTTHFGEEAVQLQVMVARQVATVLPEMNELEIRNHIKWYLVYCHRCAKRKNLVQAWRTTKDMNANEEEKKLWEEEVKRRGRDQAKEKEKAYKIQESRKFLLLQKRISSYQSSSSQLYSYFSF